MKKILYKNPEGGVCIVCPVEKDNLYPQLLAKHKREHEKGEKARRDDLSAQLAAWKVDNDTKEELRRVDLEAQVQQFLVDNPGKEVPQNLFYSKEEVIPEELVYVYADAPEFVFGEAEYEAHVRKRSLKGDEDGVRDLDDSDIPSSRMFRSAWCDDLPNSKVNIDMQKTKEMSLRELRTKRNANLDKTDKEYMQLLESDNNPERINKLRSYRKKLRDSTEALKAMDVAGKYDDELMLQLMCDECEKDLSEGKL